MLLSRPMLSSSTIFFFNDTATTEIYTLSLHDALPISATPRGARPWCIFHGPPSLPGDRKSTRLNSRHEWTSYAVFCLKKKKARNGSRLLDNKHIHEEREKTTITTA